jgi:hypothetical protein
MCWMCGCADHVGPNQDRNEESKQEQNRDIIES